MNTDKIRNFCIIAHIDHGKSTLADRLLQRTGTVNERDMQDQFLDKLDLERQRGITIKLQAVRMRYPDENGYILNLIDTPGHIDFSYEVNRALAACEGALLLVDASQGIQAQTLANYFKALEAKLTIIPVVNKIDLPSARPEEVALEIIDTFGFSHDEILFASGKTGAGVDELLEAVVARIPAPKQTPSEVARALVFDSYYDTHRGVVAMVRVMEGSLDNSDMFLVNSQQEFSPIEIGYITAGQIKTNGISTGEVGYVATGLKDIERVRVGATITREETWNKAEALPGYQEPKPMVFANLFPVDADQFKELREAVLKYKLTDAAFVYEPIQSQVLGAGFRCGFLGLLHLEVVRERVEQEYNIETQVTSPNVLYEVEFRDGKKLPLQSPEDMPDPSAISQIFEPWCKVKIYTQRDYIGDLMKISDQHRGQFIDMSYLSSDKSGTRVTLEYDMPLAEVITNFFDQVKSVSAGYASLDYELTEYRQVDLVRMDILLNGEPHEALARLAVRSQAQDIGNKLVVTLKDSLPRQQFAVPIQAAIGGKVIARETLSAVRKDVTGYLYGGDRTRKDKLLKKQAAGKKRMQAMGSVTIPHDVYKRIVSL